MKFIRIILFLFCMAISLPSYSQGQDLNSMIERINSSNGDTIKVNLLISICDSLFRTKPAETLDYGTMALELARDLKFRRGEAYALKYIGMGYYVQGEYVKAIDHFQQALEIFEGIGEKKGIANMLNSIGVIYNNEGNDAKALDLYLKSLNISEEIRDSVRVVTALINIGLIYSKKETTVDNARDYYLAALQISEALGYNDAIGAVTVNLGELFYARGDYKQALSFFERSLEAYQKSKSGNIPYTLINIGKIYARWNDYNSAIKYQEQAYDIAKQNDSKLEMGQSLLALANTNLEINETQNALKFFKQAEQITTEIGAMYERRETYRGMADTYAKRTDFINAYIYRVKESDLKDTLFSETNQLQLNQLHVQYEIETMMKENEILKRDIKLREAKNRLQMIIIVSLVLVLFTIQIFIILLTRKNKQIKKANAELAEKNSLITSQKKAITDSIHYARRIQNAILPPPGQICHYLPQSMIIFRPRDIVSGDFYWLTKSNEQTMCVVADCTGHGVPGALMSMLGNAFLNEIVSKHQDIGAAELLNELRKYVIKSLHQNQDPSIAESKDGMDIALLIFDEKMEKVEYAGANNPLLLIRDGEIIEYKGDKMPIGIHLHAHHSFSSQNIELRKDDMLYLFSDGIVDQFGGPEGKKFMTKNFKSLLHEVHARDLAVQKKLIESRLKDWMGTRDQVDDILVMGIRI